MDDKLTFWEKIIIIAVIIGVGIFCFFAGYYIREIGLAMLLAIILKR